MNLDLRIENHPVLEFKRGKKLLFSSKGKKLKDMRMKALPLPCLSPESKC